MAHLTSVYAVVQALGGIEAVMDLTGKSLKTVYHWCSLDVFPARLHDTLTKALAQKRHTAPASLFNQEQPGVVAKKSRKKAA